MTEQSTIHYERTSPQVAKVTFANPPVNLIVGETVLRLAEIVDEFSTDPDIQVGMFTFFSLVWCDPHRAVRLVVGE
ncbi:hypothetical protein [Agromyces bauzanensis]